MAFEFPSYSLRLLRFGFDVFAGDGGRERVPDDTLVGELFGFIGFNLSWRFFSP